MREKSGVEIQAQLVLFCPSHPIGEMFRLQFITIDHFSRRLGIAGMDIQTQRSRHKLEYLLIIRAGFSGCPGTPGMISGGHDAAAVQRAFLHFKPTDIIGLPAMHGHRNVQGLANRLVRIDSQLRIAGFRQTVHFFDIFRIHGVPLLLSSCFNTNQS